MIGIFGCPRINMHKIRTAIDENNQVSSPNKFDRMLSITNKGELLEYIITNNIATITSSGYTEGDEVDMWLYCTRPSEGGGLSPMVLHQQDEDTIEEWENL